MGALVLGVALMVRPPVPETLELVAAAHDLPAGATLTEADLTTTTIPRSGSPPVALDAADRAAAIGRSLVGPVAAGELLTGTRLVPRQTGEGVPAGRVAVHLVLADERAAGQLAAGQHVTLYPAAGGPPWARRALILGVDSLADPATCEGALNSEVPTSPGLTVALTPAEADAIHAGQRATEGPIAVLATPG